MAIFPEINYFMFLTPWKEHTYICLKCGYSALKNTLFYFQVRTAPYTCRQINLYRMFFADFSVNS